MDAEEALEDEDEEEGSKQKQPSSSSSSSSSSSRKWRSGSGRAMRANHILYRGLQPHAAADATVSEKEACGWWKRTPELTRSLRAAYAPELTKITWSFSCLTWRFDRSAVVFGLRVFSNSSLDCVCMCGVGLFLSPSTSERGLLMYLSCIYSNLTHGLRKRFPYKKLT